jgi:hypothetical protein
VDVPTTTVFCLLAGPAAVCEDDLGALPVSRALNQFCARIPFQYASQTQRKSVFASLPCATDQDSMGMFSASARSEPRKGRLPPSHKSLKHGPVGTRKRKALQA